MKTEKTHFGGFNLFSDSHKWVGTEHCLRDECKTCVNDHTGCLYNDGHNECMHESKFPKMAAYDSPLKKKERSKA